MQIIPSKSTVYTFSKVLVILALASVWPACKRDNQALIRQKVAERVQDFRQKKSLECRELLLSEAEEIVDSLLLTEATDALSDSLYRLRPGRPMQPPAILPIDSLQVNPLFEKIQSPADTGKKG